MPTDRTPEFRELVAHKAKELPDAKRRKLSRARPSRHEPLMKRYMQEAYNILNHITTLTRMLAHLRRPYLDVHARRPAQRAPVDLDLQGGQGWADVRYLSNEERDSVDMQARVVLARCAERVRDMEALEKRREELAAHETSPLLRMLPARLRHDRTRALSDFVAAHNAGVTWYLTRRLAEASQAQKDMQEERVRRQTERERTLGSGAAQEVALMELQRGMGSASASAGEGAGTGAGGWLGGASSSLANSLASTLGARTQGLPPEELELSEDEDDGYEDVELSASQIQQFESENAQILRAAEDTLAAVQQAEARLLEISALQVELVAQLTRQTELTDQLYEDALATTEFVEKGNVQLREARRRARDGRMWILLFLIGATLSLLFLHYY
ncbi:hypothetical protein DENSPDRAFT_829057 [Dentipellis sp. KUC8613]|nr:hypothetical protein DENSPDRAFT_829057 [Dentipellis sp. KUC8613]